VGSQRDRESHTKAVLHIGKFRWIARPFAHRAQLARSDFVGQAPVACAPIRTSGEPSEVHTTARSSARCHT
jgi:hypothetical protein